MRMENAANTSLGVALTHTKLMEDNIDLISNKTGNVRIM